MKEYIQQLVNQNHLSVDDSYKAMDTIANGDSSDIETAAFLTTLSIKGENIDEVVGMLNAMRSHMKEIKGHEDAVDVCGTGGDGAQTINASTMVAFVLAAAGVKVAKHGNRAASSKCGSFDVLEELGVNINLNGDQVKKCFDELGICCIFAPLFHPAMKHVVPIRQALGIRTVFNYLGPLLNPCRVKRQLIGVSSLDMVEKMGSVLMQTGSKKVILVHAQDGLDEVSIAAPTDVYEFSTGQETKHYVIEPDVIEPSTAGLDKTYSLDEVLGGDKSENARIMKEVLQGKGSEAQRAFIVMNSALAFVVADKASSFDEGKDLAYEILDSCKVYDLLNEYIQLSNTLKV